MVACGDQSVLFLRREDAQAVASVWALDHDVEAPLVEDRPVLTGMSGRAWGRLPEYRRVWVMQAGYDAHGMAVPWCRRVTDAWLWEFEEGFTQESAVDELLVLADGTAVVRAWGTNQEAVRRRFVTATGRVFAWTDGDPEPGPVGGEQQPAGW